MLQAHQKIAGIGDVGLMVSGAISLALHYLGEVEMSAEVFGGAWTAVGAPILQMGFRLLIGRLRISSMRQQIEEVQVEAELQQAIEDAQ